MLAHRHFLLLLAVLVTFGGPAANAQLQTFPKAELTIVSANGPHKFTVELATTPGQMEQGLMFRKGLAADAGMLFDYRVPSMAAMWMKNTLIPLAMLFVDQQGRIINIHERAVPGSLDPIAAAAPARGARPVKPGGSMSCSIRRVNAGFSLAGRVEVKPTWFSRPASS